jgi:hypothetical protein
LQAIIQSLQHLSQQITTYQKSTTSLLLASPSSSTTALPTTPSEFIPVELSKVAEKLHSLETDSTRLSDSLRAVSVASQKNYSWVIFILIYLGYQLVSQQKE